MRLTRTLGGLAFVLGALGPAGPARAFEAELQRYQQALTTICHTGVTPEIVRLYQDCFQSPGWGQ